MRKPKACLRKGSFICHESRECCWTMASPCTQSAHGLPQQATHRVPDPRGGRNESAMPPAPAPVHLPANTEGTGANGLRWRSHRVDSIVHAARSSRLHWHPARYSSSQSCHDRGSISLHAVSHSQPNFRTQSLQAKLHATVVQATAACCCCCCCCKGRVGRHARVSVGGVASTAPLTPLNSTLHCLLHSTCPIPSVYRVT